MSVRNLAKAIGRENEYRLWYQSFNNWVHADPSEADGPDWNADVLLVYCYHYFGRMLLSVPDHGGIILTADQHGVLKQFARQFS